MPPLFHIFFSIPEIFWKTEGFFYKDCCFGPVGQKNSAESWCLPSYAWKFSITEFFWNSTVFSNEKIWFSQTKNFRRKNVITPIMKKFFRYPKFSETLKGCPRIFSVLRDMKISTENRDMPPLIHKVFRYQKFSRKRKRSFTKIFVSVLWDKKFRQNRDAPPSYAWKFLIKDFFWNAKVFSNEIFWYGQTKKFWRKNVIPPIMNQFFRYPKFCETLKGCPRNFLVMRDMKISIENRDMPPLIHKFFRYQKCSGKRKRSFTNIFVSVLWDKKFRQNRDAPPSYAWKFLIKDFFWNAKVFSNEIFWYGQTKKFWR